MIPASTTATAKVMMLAWPVKNARAFDFSLLNHDCLGPRACWAGGAGAMPIVEAKIGGAGVKRPIHDSRHREGLLAARL